MLKMPDSPRKVQNVKAFIFSGGTILSEQEHNTTHQTFDVDVLIEEEETITKAPGNYTPFNYYVIDVNL